MLCIPKKWEPEYLGGGLYCEPEESEVPSVDGEMIVSLPPEPLPDDQDMWASHGRELRPLEAVRGVEPSKLLPGASVSPGLCGSGSSFSLSGSSSFSFGSSSSARSG